MRRFDADYRRTAASRISNSLPPRALLNTFDTPQGCPDGVSLSLAVPLGMAGGLLSRLSTGWYFRACALVRVFGINCLHCLSQATGRRCFGSWELDSCPSTHTCCFPLHVQHSHGSELWRVLTTTSHVAKCEPGGSGSPSVAHQWCAAFTGILPLVFGWGWGGASVGHGRMGIGAWAGVEAGQMWGLDWELGSHCIGWFDMPPSPPSGPVKQDRTGILARTLSLVPRCADPAPGNLHRLMCLHGRCARGAHTTKCRHTLRPHLRASTGTRWCKLVLA